MKKALMATDGSEMSTVAMERAAKLLGPDWEYILLKVIRVEMPLAVGAASWAPLSPIPSPEMVEEMAAASRREAAYELAETEKRLDVKGAIRVEQGDAGETICAIADGEKVDLVVVGSHGRGFARRTLLGSVSEHVVRHARQPVMVVRSIQEDA